MNFRTEIMFDSPDFLIEHQHKIFTVGSCFAENISAYLIENKFNVLCNPFGVLYNPASIYLSLEKSIRKHELTESEIVFHQDEWHSFLHHSDFSSHEKVELIERANKSFIAANKFLAQTDFLIITYGTANVYKFKKGNFIVSNCHKLPSSEFENFSLSVEEVKNYTLKIISEVKNFNKNIYIIFSVSPVRHLKDGFLINSRSKATLLLGINDAIREHKNCFYFPSYEILMDDLRDYRFYKEDLLHPNEIAIKYIWNIFHDKMLTQNCKNIIKEISPVIEAKKHKIRNPKSKQSKNFFRNNLDRLKILSEKFPHINFEDEFNYFNSLKSGELV